MKKIITKILNKMGYELLRLPAPSSIGNPTHHYLQDGTYEIQFTTVDFDGVTYFIPNYAAHKPASRSFLQGRIYEPDTHTFVRRFLESNPGSMVHAGTFFGDMLPNFSKFTPGLVYAFEPVIENYTLARLCVEKNNLDNVILINCALTESLVNVRVNTFDSQGRHSGGGSTISHRGRICPGINIDRLKLDGLTLIHLDIEGHELNALIGASHTINTHRPTIAIEDNNKECASFLSKISYRHAGRLPGLNIWTPKEKQNHLYTVRSIINHINS